MYTPDAPAGAEPAAPLIDREVSPRGRESYKPHVGNIYDWLAGAGYGVHRPAPGVVDVYRRRPDVPVVEAADEFAILRAIDAGLTAHPPHGLTPSEAREIVNQYGRPKLVTKGNLSLLPEVTLPTHRHGRDWATFHYANGTVTLRAGQPLTVAPLADLPYTVRAEHLIGRDFRHVTDFNIGDGAPGWRGRCFGQFLMLISADLPEADGAPTVNEAKFRYLQQLIGFLLHDHRRQGDTDFCVILCDDEAGGSGKGLLIKSLAKLSTVCTLDAKNDRPDFSPNDLSTATRVKVYNDVKRTFDFTALYNEITDGGTIRHMHRPPIAVPYAETWKVLVTSNFPIRGDNDSDRRRQRVFDMSLFFRADNRVSTCFGHSFFDDWDADDWAVFDSLMLGCVQAWLDCRYRPDVYESESYRIRFREIEYPAPLREYLDGLAEGKHPTGDLYKNFMMRSDVANNTVLSKLGPVRFADKLMTYYTSIGRYARKNAQRTLLYVGPKPDAPEPPPLESLDYVPPPGAQLRAPF